MKGFRIDADKLVDGLSDLSGMARMRTRVYANTVAKDLEGYIRENRPWTDRTGQARQRMTGYVKETLKGFRIVIAHGVDYGVWLELAHEKRFAILEPTIRLKGPDIIKGMKELLKD